MKADPAFLDYVSEKLPELSRELGADALSLYEKDADEGAVRLLAWVGEKPRETAPFTVPPVGTCAASGKGLLIEKKHTRPEKYRSIVTVPIESGGTVLGVMNAASTQAGFFKDTKRLTAVRAIAEHLARLWAGPAAESLH